MIRILACPWQKVIHTEKIVGNFSDGNPNTTIITNVKFGECMNNCPFYEPIGDYCRRINKHD